MDQIEVENQISQLKKKVVNLETNLGKLEDRITELERKLERVKQKPQTLGNSHNWRQI